MQSLIQFSRSRSSAGYKDQHISIQRPKPASMAWTFDPRVGINGGWSRRNVEYSGERSVIRSGKAEASKGLCGFSRIVYLLGKAQIVLIVVGTTSLTSTDSTQTSCPAKVSRN